MLSFTRPRDSLYRYPKGAHIVLRNFMNSVWCIIIYFGINSRVTVSYTSHSYSHVGLTYYATRTIQGKKKKKKEKPFSLMHFVVITIFLVLSCSL
ncbi:hypothetical protein F5Y11DRAFT_320904 [Daldinia sp. FL1419]|nr:hypothetical protein F5Y11DRAFT_320904 [Daldinia sp. FL1419]